MNLLQTPLENKEEFERTTLLVPFTPAKGAKWSDPDTWEYKLIAGTIFAMSIYGRQYCTKNNLP